MVLGSFKVKLWIFLLVMLFLRLYWAARAPLANDEVYYWDWGRDLLLSFVDHPPGVAWIARIGTGIGAWFRACCLNNSQSASWILCLAPRLLVPFLHLAATIVFLKCLKVVRGSEPSERQILSLIFLMQIVPVFSLGGFLLLPDAGLFLGLSMCLYLLFSYVRKQEPLTCIQGALLGIVLGFCGICKYHAAPLALGLLVGFMMVRKRKFWQEWGFYIGMVLLGLIVTTPVWWWNYQHDFVSFRFQGEHGFGGLSIDFSSAGRVLIGELFLLTPLVFGGMVIFAGREVLKLLKKERSLDLIAVLGFWPLFLLLFFVSFFKQNLPHWVMPAFWLMLPSYALSSDGRLWKGWSGKVNTIYAMLLTFLLSFAASTDSVRQAVIKSFNGKPGHLSEYTLWPSLIESALKHPMVRETLKGKDQSEGTEILRHCPKPVAIASLRWFWTAQIAFNWPGQPKVYDLDIKRPSYYGLRDDLSILKGCPVVVIGDKRHVKAEVLSKMLSIEAEDQIIVPDHLDTPVIVIKAKFI